MYRTSATSCLPDSCKGSEPTDGTNGLYCWNILHICDISFAFENLTPRWTAYEYE